MSHRLEGLTVAIPRWFESTRPHYLPSKRITFIGFSLILQDIEGHLTGTIGSPQTPQNAEKQVHWQQTGNKNLLCAAAQRYA